MPIFANNMDDHKLGGSTFGFSAKRIADLGATEYTLVGIAADTSGSVDAFRPEIEACVKEIVKSCRLSPRADNLMLRLVTFDDRLTEVHGFRPLLECNGDDYTNCIKPGGMTALYDASCNLTDSIAAYGKQLAESDYGVNAIVFVITDGEDNRSAMTAMELKKALVNAVQSEALESIRSVLIGVNVKDARVSKYLAALQVDAGFSQYVEIGDANEKSLAKVAEFVSKSISAQSVSLGSGGPSQALTF